MFLNQMWQAIQLWIPWPYFFSCRKFPVHIVKISSNGNKDSSSYLVILVGTGVLVWLVFVRYHKEKDKNIKIVGRENYGDQLLFLFDSQTIFVSTLWSWVQTSTVQNSLPFLKKMNCSTMPSCKGRPTLLHIHLLTDDYLNRPKAVGVTEWISFMKILIDI